MSLIRCLLYGFVNYSGKETKSLVIKEQEVCKATYQGPHSHILMTGGGGGGGVRVIFLGLKFWPKVIFWVYERCWDFFWCKKKTEGFFVVAKKGLRDILGYG